MYEEAKANIAAHVIKGLEKRNMEAYFCASYEEAAKKILECIEPGSSVAWGGSMSLKELGLETAIKEGDYKKVKYPDPEAAVNYGYKECTDADYFIMGTNAITVDGVLLNVDGTGNRVACLAHGPKHVIVIAGLNKLVRTVEEGFDRVQTQICPIMAGIAKRKTPCGEAGFCADCHTKDCMCCSILVTRHSRADGRIKVFIVGENIGI